MTPLTTVVAYMEGWDAYNAGTPRLSCPYSIHSVEMGQWLAGWDDAKEADK